MLPFFRDVSFLYDVPKKDEKPVHPDKFDPSVVRMEEQQEKKKVFHKAQIVNQLHNSADIFISYPASFDLSEWFMYGIRLHQTGDNC